MYKQLCCLYKQLYDYFDVIFSRNQCGFRKGFSVVNCLLPMIEKWRGSLNQSGACAALLTDLSKAFNCLLHELIIAKLYAYEIHMPLLKVINSYSFTRTQRIKMNVYSSWSEILFDIPQSSILGALLFNIFICDLFMFLPKTILLIMVLMIIPCAQQVTEFTTYLIKNKPQTFC